MFGNTRKILLYGIPYVLVAFIASAVTYLLVTGYNDHNVEELQQRIADLEKKERAALITQRVSEQMEDLANAQRNISDRQRQRAEEQSRIADMERGKALLERSIAQKAERQAREAAQEASSMRLIAEEQSQLAMQNMLQAQEAKSKADTLFYQALGRSLAQTSIAQMHSGNRELATLLAYSGWDYSNRYNANTYQSEIFEALQLSATSAQIKLGKALGSVWEITPLPQHHNRRNANDDFLAVSDYGEVIHLYPTYTEEGYFDAYRQRLLYSNPQYLFRKVLTGDRGMVFILDASGYLFSLDTNKNPSAASFSEGLFLCETAREREIWKFLVLTPSGLIAAGHHQIVWLDSLGKKILGRYYSENTITAMALGDGMLHCFCNKGEILTFDDATYRQLPKKNESANLKRNNATCYYYSSQTHQHFVGTENGEIFIYDNSQNHVYTLVGHTGAITDILLTPEFLVTSSYDRTLRMWNVHDLLSLQTPIVVEYAHSPLCMYYDADDVSLQLGFQDGDIYSMRISVTDNARSALKNITREFTPQEWEHFVGKSIPYRTFMKRKEAAR